LHEARFALRDNAPGLKCLLEFSDKSRCALTFDERTEQ
jgi:hypothetical protein